MSYNEMFKNSMEKYEKLLTAYKESLSKDYYIDTAKSASFDFLIGMHTYEALELFNTADESAEFYITSLKEALALFQNVVDYRKRIDDVLEKANTIVEVGESAEKLNEFVRDCPYLPTSASVSYNKALVEQARDVLKRFPNFKKYYTKKFKSRFIESCAASLDKDELRSLIANGVVKAADLDMLKLVGNDHYMDNLAFMCEELNHTELVKESHKVSLRGVSFANDDGEQRQDLIAKVREAQVAQQRIELTAVPYKYTPEIGEPEDAVRVDWNDHTLGHIDKGIVTDVNSRYVAPQYRVDLVGVTGGENGLNYGCDVMLTIVSTPTMVKQPEVQKDPQPEIEK